MCNGCTPRPSFNCSSNYSCQQGVPGRLGVGGGAVQRKSTDYTGVDCNCSHLSHPAASRLQKITTAVATAAAAAAVTAGVASSSSPSLSSVIAVSNNCRVPSPCSSSFLSIAGNSGRASVATPQSHLTKVCCLNNRLVPDIVAGESGCFYPAQPVVTTTTADWASPCAVAVGGGGCTTEGCGGVKNGGGGGGGVYYDTSGYASSSASLHDNISEEDAIVCHQDMAFAGGSSDTHQLKMAGTSAVHRSATIDDGIASGTCSLPRQRVLPRVRSFDVTRHQQKGIRREVSDVSPGYAAVLHNQSSLSPACQSSHSPAYQSSHSPAYQSSHSPAYQSSHSPAYHADLIGRLYAMPQQV